MEPGDLPDKSYQYEKLLLSLVRQGETELLRELLEAPPMVQVGKMSDDTLRQTQNTGICTAAIVSRAAIDGGLDNRTAFLLSDLYIQNIELMRDIPSLEKLRNDIMLDYAERVRRIRYRVRADESGDLFFRLRRVRSSKPLLSPARRGRCRRPRLLAQLSQQPFQSAGRYDAEPVYFTGENF